MPALNPQSIRVVHPTGNANVRAALEALDSAGSLAAFHTCIGVGNDAENSISGRLFKQRSFPVENSKIITQPYREFLRLLCHRRGWLPSLLQHEVGALSVDKIYQSLDCAVAQFFSTTETLPTTLYAYEDGAAQCFQAAKERGVRTVYDLPIGYWRAAQSIQKEESERLPEWAGTMPALIDSQAKLERKDMELQLADQIIVASQFTANTLEQAPFPLAPITVIPYGCPTVLNTAIQPSDTSAPLKVLYVGGLSQRKGLSYLLDAVASLGSSVELTIVGKRVADCKPLDAALKQHRWIESLPHDEILEIMKTHDVFVFPSLFEGFGLVLTESLSQGLPIITTTHSCAPDIIEDGKEGFIVPIRDSEAIASKLELLNSDRNRLDQMKHAALDTAARTTWSNYSQGLVNIIQSNA